MVKVMKITSFKSSHAGSAACSARNPAAGHRWPTPPPETPGHSRASLGQSLVGSQLSSPGSWCTQGSICAIQESVSQSCESSGGSMVGIMVTFSKRAYSLPRSAAPRAPAPVAGHCWPIPLQETLKHSSVSVSVGSLGPGVYKVWDFWASLVGMGFDSKWDFTPSTVLLGLFLWPWMWGISKDGEALHTQQKQDRELTVAWSWTPYHQIQT